MIDAHQHFMADHQPATLAGELQATGVEATVLVQAFDSPDENDRLRDHAETTPFVAGVVGWLPLGDPDAARRELARSRTAAWCGVRCLVGRDPIEWLENPQLFRELAATGLVWDVVPVTPDQVGTVLRIAAVVPELRIVVDHLARPPLENRGWQPWADQIRALADHPGIAAKVSIGIDVLTSWRWQADALDRYVAHAVRCFGPDRLMLASNWPVVLRRRSYSDTWRDLTATLTRIGLTAPEQSAILATTAHHWYRLDS